MKDKKKVLVQKRSAGSVMDIIVVYLYIITLTIVMLAYVGNVQMLNCKMQIGQIARKYILRMETVGFLMENDRISMEQELLNAGVDQLDLSGTTLDRVSFGEPIYLVIRGQISAQVISMGNDLFQTVFAGAQLPFEERKMSTAKN